MLKRIALAAFLLLTPALQAQTTITGRLLGSDGRPMRAAHVSVMRPNDRAHQVSHPVGVDGRYSVVVPDTGLRLVQFTGVDHLVEEIAIVTGGRRQTIEVDVTLGRHDYLGSFEGVQVIGEFNDFSWETGVPMERQPDGSYVAEVPAADDTIYYQLLHLAKDRSINGTAGVAWRYDGGGDYESAVLASGGRARIVFDPSALVRSDARGTVAFSDRSRHAERINAAYTELAAMRREIARANSIVREQPELEAEQKAIVLTLLDSLERELLKERDPGMKLMRAAQYVTILSSWWHGDLVDSLRSQRVRATLVRLIPPTSEIHSLGQWNLFAAAQFTDTLREDYLFDVVARHYDDRVRFEAGQPLSQGLEKLSRSKLDRYLAAMLELTERPEHAEYRAAVEHLVDEARDTVTPYAPVTGVLLDSLDRPLARRSVRLTSGWPLETPSTGHTDESGRFSIETRKRGLLRLSTFIDDEVWETRLPLADAGRLAATLRISGPADRYGHGSLSLRLQDSVGRAGRIVAIYERSRQRQHAVEQAYRAHTEAGLDAESFRFDWGSYAASVAGFDAEFDAETDSVARQMLLLDHLDLLRSIRDTSMRKQTRELRRRALTTIPPSSRLWSLDQDWLTSMLWSTSDTSSAALTWAYVDRVEREHPDPSLRSEILYRTVEMGQFIEDSTTKRRADEALALLIEKYPHHSVTDRAIKQFGAARLDRGDMIPSFTFVSLDDPTKVFTRENMKGKTYLVDLWATWCGPCIGELPTLTSAYEKYHPAGFEILSISFDGSPDEVTKFRGKKWKMPWLHSFSPGGFESSAAKIFNVNGIPQTYLVGPDGRIIAADVRGDMLLGLRYLLQQIGVGVARKLV